MRLALPSTRLLARIGLGVLAVLGVVMLLAVERVFWLRGSLPDLSGTVSAADIENPVTVRRDRNGIPHIHGQSLPDVYFALGYAHAQDRLWQMDFGRRAALGRLSELVGSRALEADLYLRAADFDGYARASFERLSPIAQDSIRAYVAGINTYLARGPRPLSPEFGLAMIAPEPWEPHHAVVMLKAVALGLSTNVGGELFRTRLKSVLTPGEIAQFLPPYPGDAPIAIRSADLADAASALERAQAAFDRLPPVGASNNWVVGGAHTASGKPLLANDPHLGMTAPSAWYLVHLNVAGRPLVGGTMPGIPAILLGRNDKAAWGLTNTGSDVQDLFLERLDPEDPDKYLAGDGSVAFGTRTETFRVRFGEDVTHVYRTTRNGPVLPDDLDAVKSATPEGHVLALGWTALTPDNTTIDVPLRALEIADWESFNARFANYIVPMQSIVYADTEGSIGMLAPGRVPLRAPDHPTKGLMPVQGWVDRNRWQGFVPFEGLPRIKDPASGRIVTANHKIVPQDYPYFLTSEWDAPYRADRIDALLAARSDHTLETMAEIQRDTVSLLAREMLPFLLETQPATQRSADALALLRAWDGAYDRELAAPLVFEAWHRALAEALYADELGALFERAWSHRPIFLMNVLRGEPGMAHWCDDRETLDRVETCEEILTASLETALGGLARVYGRRMDRWTWGEAHPVVNAHRPLSFVPLIGGFFDIRTPSDGGFFTVDRGANYFGGKEPFANVHASGYRAIYDMADLDASLYMISTGQSGNVFSPHYADLTGRWADGAYVRIPTDEASVADATVETLRLEPLAAGAP